MSLIPNEFINEVISRTDIVELIDARVPLKKSGHNYQACCPFHEEKTPSFTVNLQKQFYYCFGCGAGGNVIGFLMAYERLTFVDAIEVLANSLQMPIPLSSGNRSSQKSSIDLYAPLERSAQYYEEQLWRSSTALQYLRSRQLSEFMIKNFHLGYAPDNDSHAMQDRFRGRIIFPIHDRKGRVIGFGGRSLEDKRLPKYLNSSDSPLFHKSTVLYGLYQALQANRHLDKIIIVEGYMDVISLAQAGISYAAATLGTATTSQHINQLFQYVSQILFCFDGDSAGRKAAWRALTSALPVLRDTVIIRFLFLPEKEDPDSLIKKEGKENFLRRSDQALPLGDFFFQQLKSQVSLTTVEGRAQLASLALPYLENISAPLFREMMHQQLSEIVRLDAARLILSEKTAISSTRNLRIRRTPMRLAIALLLQYPSLVKNITEKHHVFTWNFKGSELFKNIVALLNNPSIMTTAHILEYFRDTPESSLLYKLAVWPHGVPVSGTTAEWCDILNALEKEYQNNLIQQLLQKSALGAITEQERKELQKKLAKK